MLKKLIVTALLFSSSLAYGDSTDDKVLSGVKAYQAAKCLSYLEVAGETEGPTYNAIARVYFSNAKIYVENALTEDFKQKSPGKNIPMTWFGLVSSNHLGSEVLIGRLLQWTSGVESQRIADTYAPNARVIPENVGVAEFNKENCSLLTN